MAEWLPLMAREGVNTRKRPVCGAKSGKRKSFPLSLGGGPTAILSHVALVALHVKMEAYCLYNNNNNAMTCKFCEDKRTRESYAFGMTN